MIKDGNALYSESEEETIRYLKDLLEDFIKFRAKVWKINKEWVGIDRSLENMATRIGEKLEPIFTLLEYIYFTVTKEIEVKEPLDDERELYKKALKKWGKDLQLNMVFEESGELIMTLSQLIRGRKDKRDLASEIADVEIMLNQLKLIYGIDLDVLNWKFCKLERLKERLE